MELKREHHRVAPDEARKRSIAPREHVCRRRRPHNSITSRLPRPAKGAPVVLIPGLSSPPRDLGGRRRRARGRTTRVYIVQVNGFGGDDPRANLQPGILAGAVAELDAFLQKEKRAGVAVVGHSMGGHDRADAGQGASRPGLEADDRRCVAWVGTLFGAQQVTQVEAQGKLLRDQMAARYGKPDPANDQAVAANNALKPESRTKVAAWSARADARVSGQALYEDLTTDLRGEVAGIAQPITLVMPFGGLNTQPRAEAVYRAAYAPAPRFKLVAIGRQRAFRDARSAGSVPGGAHGVPG
jgi:pimeloyl-ACP methyl ester carboxylesterase